MTAEGSGVERRGGVEERSGEMMCVKRKGVEVCGGDACGSEGSGQRGVSRGDPEVRAFEPASSSKCCANRECLPLRTAPALHP